MFTMPTCDQLAEELRVCEAEVSRLRARQLVLLRRLDQAQAAQGDGHRSLQEWTAATLDVRAETARDLVMASRVVPFHRSIGFQLADRRISFDRAVVSAKLAAAGVSHEVLVDSFDRDLPGVQRLAAQQRRVTRRDEHEAAAASHFTVQPTLDESRYKVWGEFTAYDGRVIDKAVTQRSDDLEALPHGGQLSRSQRRAAAVVAMAQDSLDGGRSESGAGSAVGPGGGTGVGHLALFADLDQMAASGGELGAEIEFGPRVGPATLEEILCGGSVQIIGLQHGRPVVTTDSTKAIPPAVRRFVAWRDGGCTVAGCTSRYRLQPHHIRLRAEGGTHDPENIATLCWFHHHVMIHQHGYRIDPESPRHRRRLLRPCRGPDPP